MKSFELEEEKKEELNGKLKPFDEFLSEIEFNTSYGYEDNSLSLISDMLIEIKRMVSKKHNQLLSASRISRDLNDLLLILNDTACSKEEFASVKELLLKLNHSLITYLDSNNDALLDEMINIVVQLKESNKNLIDKTRELNKTPAGQALLDYYGKDIELIKAQAETNLIIRKTISKEIKEKYPTLDLYDYTELDNAYKDLYNAIKNDDAEEITNTRGVLIKKLKKYNKEIKQHAKDLDTIIEIYKIINIDSLDLNTKVIRIKEIIRRESNPELRNMLENNLDNYIEFKKEFYELYNLLEVKKTELYKESLKEELRAHGEFLKKRYNDEVLSRKFSLTKTIPKGIGYSVKKLANAIDRIKYNEYSRKKKSLIKEAVLDAFRVVSVPGVSALKFGADNWYTIYLVSNGLISINNERTAAANAYKELNPGVSDEDALKHVDGRVKDVPYRQQTQEYKNEVSTLALDREVAIKAYIKTHAGVTREQAEKNVDQNRDTTPYREQAIKYEQEYTSTRAANEESDKTNAINNYMIAYGVGQEEAEKAVEANHRVASYENQARTYDDIAKNNATQQNSDSTPVGQNNTNQTGTNNAQESIGVLPKVELDTSIEDKIDAIGSIGNAYGSSTTLDNVETGEKVIIIHGDDNKYYTMRFDKEGNPIDSEPVPCDNLNDFKNNNNYVLSDEMIDIYDVPEVSNETMIRNLDVGNKMEFDVDNGSGKVIITRLGEDDYLVETIDNSNSDNYKQDHISMKTTPNYFEKYNNVDNEDSSSYQLKSGSITKGNESYVYENQQTSTPEMTEEPAVETPALSEEEKTILDEKIEAIDSIGGALGSSTTLDNNETGEKIIIIHGDDDKYYTMRFDRNGNPIDSEPVPCKDIEELKNNQDYVLSEEMIDIYDVPEVSNETMIKNIDVGDKIVYSYGNTNGQTINIIRLDDDRFYVETINNSNGKIVDKEIVSLTETPDYFAEFDEEYNSEVGCLYEIKPGSVEHANPTQVAELKQEDTGLIEDKPEEKENEKPVPYTPDPELEHLNYVAQREKAMTALDNMSSGDTLVVEYFENEETHTLIIYKVGDAYYALNANDVVDVDRLYEMEMKGMPEGTFPYLQISKNVNSPSNLRDKFVRIENIEDLQGCTLYDDNDIEVPDVPPSFFFDELEVGQTVTFKNGGNLVHYKKGEDGRMYYSVGKEGENPNNPALVIDNKGADRQPLEYAYENKYNMDLPMDDLINQLDALQPGQSITLGFVEDLSGPIMRITRRMDGSFDLTTNYGEETQTNYHYATAPELAKEGLDKQIPQVLINPDGSMPNGIIQNVKIPIWVRPDFYNAAPVTNVQVILYNGQIIGVKLVDPNQTSAVDHLMNFENPIEMGLK